MSDEREAAVEEFDRAAQFEQTAYRALRSVLNRQPISLMLVYEYPDGQVALTTVPFSPQLARGLTDAAHTLMWQGSVPEEGEEEDVDED
jgi:hypothetical protein